LTYISGHADEATASEDGSDACGRYREHLQEQSAIFERLGSDLSARHTMFITAGKSQYGVRDQ